MLAAVCMVVIVAFLGLSIDSGVLRYRKRQLQNAADASALAGALELSACGAAANCAAMRTAAQAALTENGLTASSLLVNCATGNTLQLQLTLNNPPCALAGDPNLGNSTYVEAVVSAPVSTVFAKVIGIDTVNIAARAEATVPPSPCVYLLSQSTSQPSLTLINQTIQAKCAFYLGLSYNFNGGSSSTGSPYFVAGGPSGSTGTISPSPSFNSPRTTDPLASLPVPTYSGCTQTNYKVTAAANLQPGTYCGGLTINTSSTVTLAPGTYVILGALTINGPNLSGSGITFYVSQGNGFSYGASSIQNINATLSAPTSGSLKGILYFSDRTLPAGNAGLTLANWNPGTRLDGIFYLAGQEITGSNVTLQGNNYFGLVADYCELNNSGFSPSTNYASLVGGSPFPSAKAGSVVVQ
ncbi:pilus assembly protein TadG-related protein [Granulicella sibirica]|uniref:pilus assembly protein TadG-related protein n=1 Tax=Granulicella sibirica TaxID=2479048 RepID=UPI0013757D55|nr:pilus assembly protein TadG-related protein [Granulicella sibirica]